MNRKMELEHLALADKAVAEGERHIAREEQMISDLDRAGYDTKEARSLLATYRRTQDAHVAHRKLILETLQQKDRPGPIFRPGHLDDSPPQAQTRAEQAKDGAS